MPIFPAITKRNVLVLLVLIAFFFMLYVSFFIPAFAQTDEEKIDNLRRQIEELEQQASQFKQNIASERTKGNSLRVEISVLKNQISRLETQIRITSRKISGTFIEIEGTRETIFEVGLDIEKQKAVIARLLLSLNHQDSETLIEVLMRNDSISDFFRFEQYGASLTSNLMDILSQLRESKEDAKNYQVSLEIKKDELEYLNQQHSSEKFNLAGARSSKNTLLKETRGQEAIYQKRLVETQRLQAEFFTEMRKLEQQAIEGGLFIVHVTAKDVPARNTNFMSWPLDSYILTQGYGFTSYARNSRAYGGAPHNGIDIAAAYGTPVTSVADGEVIAFGFNDGFGNWVAVRHPPYDLVSVYGHLSSLAVGRIGIMVRSGDTIAYEGSTGNSTGAHLHLSLYKDFFTYEKKGQLYFNYFDGTLNPFYYLP